MEFYIKAVRVLCEGFREKYKRPYSILKEAEKMIKQAKIKLLAKSEDNSLTRQDIQMFERLMENIVILTRTQKKKAFRYILEDILAYFDTLFAKGHIESPSFRNKKIFLLSCELKQKLENDLESKEFESFKNTGIKIVRHLETSIDIVAPKLNIS